VCESADHHEQLMLCDMCDEAYHTYCLRPVLKRVPSGEWSCPRCDGSGQTECPDKHMAPITLGLKRIETTVHVHWESVKKGSVDGIVMQRVVTRRPKKVSPCQRLGMSRLDLVHVHCICYSVSCMSPMCV